MSRAIEREMAEMGSMSNDSVKIPKFDGKRGNYAMWKAQFVALCALKNCSEALMPTFKAELPDCYIRCDNRIEI